MKKLFLLCFAVLLGSVCFAQSAYKKAMKTDEKSTSFIKVSDRPVVGLQSQVKPVPATKEGEIFTEGFEFTSEALENGWTSIDNDGDGEDWFVYSADISSHSGVYSIASASYNYGALTPENWLISPAITIPETEVYALKYYVAAQDPAWTSEHYKVCVSTTTATATTSFTDVIYEETLPGAGWYERVCDLSAYRGQTIYIAFVHYNCTDFFYLKLDDVSVYLNYVVDATITDVTAPNHGDFSSCGFSTAETVTATIANNGGDTISNFNVSYSINGGTPVVETVTSSIACGQTLDYSFTQKADLSALGEYEIVVSVDLTDDELELNNEKTLNVLSGDALIAVHSLSDNMGGQSWQIINNLNNEILAQRLIFWQWNVELTENVCALSNQCYNVIVSDADGDGMVDGSAFVEVLYNGTQVGGSTTADSWSTATLEVENLGTGCLAVSMKMISVETANSSCSLGQEDVEIVVKNSGSQDISNVPVSYSVDGGTPVNETIAGPIAVGTEFSYTFTNKVDLSTIGEYSIVASVNAAEDANTSDNTDTVSVKNIESVVIGQTPYVVDFNGDNFEGIAVLDENGDENSWGLYYTDDTYTDGLLGYGYSSESSADDWFILSCMDFAAGEYTLSFDYTVASENYPENLLVAFGNAQTAEAMTNTIVDLPSMVNTDFVTSANNFTIATDGTYYIGFKCYSDADMYAVYVDNINVSIATSINETEKAQITVYPNPANDVINVNGAENSKIEIMNVIGEVVTTIEKANANQMINVSNLSKGIYFVRVENNVYKINITK